MRKVGFLFLLLAVVLVAPPAGTCVRPGPGKLDVHRLLLNVLFVGNRPILAAVWKRSMHAYAQ